ncbi:aspartate/glutamate racemase family protein [Streptomyces sp. NPDC001817]|uniref:aspartate/glutamate racemase family protein n=1 Tax=Streptomyces sp. NPDC001817 TaxID=3154398 RepID=UPI0033265A7E
MSESPTTPHRRLGVLGGMGPVASAQFVSSVYDHCGGAREQDFPALVLHSEPAVSPRTPATMDAGESPVLTRMVTGLSRLVDCGCEDIVMCCMTSHHLLPRISPELSGRVISVLDVAVDEIARRGGRHLLLCSTDSRALRLFERHPRWERAEPHVVMAEAAEYRTLQDAIQDIKTNKGPDRAVDWITRHLKETGASSVIAGCSEIHVLSRRWGHLIDADVLDPFDVLARAAADGRLADYRYTESEKH